MKKLLVLFCVLIACSTPSKKIKDEELLKISLKDLKGSNFQLSSLIQSRATVVIFLSPECPICQGYSLTMKNLWEKFNQSNISFAGVIPGNDYSINEVDSFAKTYSIPFPIYFDEQKELTHYLKATVTPQCYVIDKNGNVLYSGKIDDYAVAPGIKKQRVTQNYLSDALTSILMNKKIETIETEPQGCFIEK
jgi:peroxiredoxin